MKDFDKSFLYKLRLVVAYKDIFRNHGGPFSLFYFNQFRQAQLKAAHRLAGKEKLEVAFFLTIPGMWKSDEVFKAMLNNPSYHPYIVIYPYSAYKEFDKKEIRKAIERTKAFIEAKGYEYIVPYDEQRDKWLDVKKIKSPDMVFFSTPYKDSLPQYFVYNFKNWIICLKN